jgi:hypothetical protein
MKPGEILQYTHRRAPLCAETMSTLLDLIDRVATDPARADLDAQAFFTEAEILRDLVVEQADDLREAEAREKYAHQRACRAYLGVG